jgi:hypothetical protein
MKCKIESKCDFMKNGTNIVELTIIVYNYNEGSTLKLGIAEIQQPVVEDEEE